MVSRNDIAGEWFHGDLVKTNFHDRKFDVEDYTRDRNALGPGIYFTRDKSQASGYSAAKRVPEPGFVYTVTVNTIPKCILEDGTPVDVSKLRRFVNMCPDKDSLYNYSTNIHNAVNLAVKMNAESSDNMLDAVCGVYNDLYGRDSTAFAQSMTKIGYDALLHRLPEVDHLIVYNPDIIHVLKEEPYVPINEIRKIIRQTLSEML